MSIMSMKLYYHYCPEITHNMAYFPKTVAGGDLASLIQVDGRCVSNAVYSNSDGQYECECVHACLKNCLNEKSLRAYFVIQQFSCIFCYIYIYFFFLFIFVSFKI